MSQNQKPKKFVKDQEVERLIKISWQLIQSKNLKLLINYLIKLNKNIKAARVKLGQESIIRINKQRKRVNVLRKVKVEMLAVKLKKVEVIRHWRWSHSIRVMFSKKY